MLVRRAGVLVAAAVIAAALAGPGCLELPGADEFASGRGAEAGAGVAAPADAGPAVDAPPGAPDADADAAFRYTCPASAIVCDDFEIGSLAGPFSNVRDTPELTTTAFHSPTHALHARITQGQNASGLETYPTLTKTAHVLDLWVRAPVAVPYDGYKVRLAHALFGPGCDWDLTMEIWLEAGGLGFGAETYDSANPSCSPVAGSVARLADAAAVFDGGWHHVVAALDTSGQTKAVSLTFDGGSALRKTVTSKRTAPPTALSFAVGISCVQTSGGCFAWDKPDPYELWIDDVTFDAP